MATIEINKKEFEELLGQEISDEKLKEEASFLGAHWNPVEGKKWQVETYPNRPDLLSVEGLARAYRGFFDIEEGREEYEVQKGSIEVEVDSSVEEVRPYIGGAVVRGLELNERMINGLIQLQEKMHETLGRRRDKLAIGLHDLDQVEPPFTYRAVEPEKVSFTPLEYDKEMQLGKILDEHEKGQKYSWIIEDEDRYPIIEDSDHNVLSFPPIINNQLTEVETGTEDIFIDVTGKDKATVLKALNILTTALAERGGEIETVTVGGEKMPDLEPESWELEIDYFQEVSGLDLEGKEIGERLEQMKLGTEVKKGKIKVEVPCYRTDVMHQYDLIEDAVIAHRYDNIDPEVPEIDQVAEEKPVEGFSQLIREILVGTGALETHTYILSNRDKLSEYMNREQEFVEMSNALTEDYTAVRNWLLPSLFEVLKNNRHRSYPQNFFEVEDVVEIRDEEAVNVRKAAYVTSGNDKDFTDAREVLQVVERDLGVEFEVEAEELGCFRGQRSGRVLLEGEKVGIIGEFSSEVLENWELEAETAGFELNIEKIRGF